MLRTVTGSGQTIRNHIQSIRALLRIRDNASRRTSTRWPFKLPRGCITAKSLVIFFENYSRRVRPLVCFFLNDAPLIFLHKKNKGILNHHQRFRSLEATLFGFMNTYIHNIIITLNRISINNESQARKWGMTLVDWCQISDTHSTFRTDDLFHLFYSIHDHLKLNDNLSGQARMYGYYYLHYAPLTVVCC